MTEKPMVGVWPVAVAFGASLLGTGLVCACGLACLFVLAVAMNGFQQSQATPIMVGVILLVLLCNLGVTGILNVAVLRQMGAWEARFAKAATAVSAGLATLTPVVCVGGFFALGGSL